MFKLKKKQKHVTEISCQTSNSWNTNWRKRYW